MRASFLAMLVALLLPAGAFTGATRSAQAGISCAAPDSGYYTSYAARRGNVIFSCVTGSLTHHGGTFVVVDTAPKLCGSCHGQTLYVFRGRHLTLTIAADDPRITPIADGFRLLQPVRVGSEPLCCPSHAFIVDYLWNGAHFVALKRGTVKV